MEIQFCSSCRKPFQQNQTNSSKNSQKFNLKKSLVKNFCSTCTKLTLNLTSGLKSLNNHLNELKNLDKEIKNLDKMMKKK